MYRREEITEGVKSNHVAIYVLFHESFNNTTTSVRVDYNCTGSDLWILNVIFVCLKKIFLYFPCRFTIS